VGEFRKLQYPTRLLPKLRPYFRITITVKLKYFAACKSSERALLKHQTKGKLAQSRCRISAPLDYDTSVGMAFKKITGRTL
jgi:hypothetical protein